MQGQHLVDCDHVVHEEVLKPIPRQYDIVVMVEVLLNAGGVEPPSEDVDHVGSGTADQVVDDGEHPSLPGEGLLVVAKKMHTTVQP